ncbi:MAG: hypothetical protein ABR520_10785, partial [Mycobacteriales bacterium]
MPADRCPRCGAAVKTGAEWCTLCYADLRPPPRRPVTQPAGPSHGPRGSTTVAMPDIRNVD